jgi:hypothetical protein
VVYEGDEVKIKKETKKTESRIKMETLYHYCSTSTFISIISNNSIWLSSLSLSNDTMEGRILRKTLIQMLANGKAGEEEIGHIESSLDFVENFFDGLGFCLSAEPDLLSQWRGYADDGQGFSIGFSKYYLEKMCKAKDEGDFTFFLSKVLYEPSEHEQELIALYRIIKEQIDSGKLKMPPVGGFRRPNEYEKLMKEYVDSISTVTKTIIGHTYKNIYRMKGKAFSEEKEWRLFTLLMKENDDLSFVRSGINRLVPYKKVILKELDIPIINKIYIGPRNITPGWAIRKFLTQSGFNDVSIEKAAATYR